MAEGSVSPLYRRIRWMVGLPSAGGCADSELLARFCADRDEGAFTALLQRHGPLVLNVCQRVLGNEHDADDAFQATFLVLAKKADAIRRGEAVGSWLYGVAYRIASKARGAAARRRDREQHAAGSPVEPPPGEDGWAELRPILDEELSRLPEKYRAPVVLRYLQGKSHEEAARELGWPSGSLSWRLARALELLRDRLARRGVTLTAAAWTTLLADRAQSATVTGVLADSTCQAALQFVAGQAAGGALSPGAIALAKGALQSMWITRMKSIVTLVLSVGLLGAGLGLAGYHLLASNATAVPVPVKPADPAGTRLEMDKTYAGTFQWRFDFQKGEIKDRVIRLFAKDKEGLAGFVEQVPATAFGGDTKGQQVPNPGALIRQAAVDFRSQRVIAVAAHGPPTIFSVKQLGDLARVVYAEDPSPYARPNHEGSFTAVVVNGTPSRAEFVQLLASQPVFTRDLAFMALADPRWIVPAKGGTSPVSLGLWIRNFHEPDVELALPAVTVRLRPVGGKELPFLSSNRASGPFEPPFKIGGGASDAIWRNAQLEWDTGGTLRLSGSFGGDRWSFEGLQPGKYLVGFSYSGEVGGKKIDAKTQTIPIEIKRPTD